MSCKPACSTCARLRSAALMLVGAGGVDGLTEESLERSAGLAHEDAVDHYSTPVACLHATYEEVAETIATDFMAAFSTAVSWESALGTARRRLLMHLASHPAHARLCFVETLGGDRELRRLRERRRRSTVDFLVRRRREPGGPRRWSRLQIELLVGATFHEISAAVAAGGVNDLPTLEPRLADLARMFDPSAGREMLTPRPQPALSAQ